MGRIITDLCRIIPYHIATPKTQTNQDGSTVKKYSASLLFPKTDETGIQRIIQEAFNVGREEFGEHFWTMVQQRSLKWPVRDGDEIVPEKGAARFPGHWYINVSAFDPVQLVSRWADPNDPDRKPMVITDYGQLYAGEWVKASITIRAFRKQSSGVACHLNNLQLWHEGERLDNRVDAKDDFNAEGDAPAADLARINGQQAPGPAPQAAPAPNGYAAPGPGPQPQASPAPGPGPIPQGGGSNLL